jgi:hypothetical protein
MIKEFKRMQQLAGLYLSENNINSQGTDREYAEQAVLSALYDLYRTGYSAKDIREYVEECILDIENREIPGGSPEELSDLPYSI